MKKCRRFNHIKNEKKNKSVLGPANKYSEKIVTGWTFIVILLVGFCSQTELNEQT